MESLRAFLGASTLPDSPLTGWSIILRSHPARNIIEEVYHIYANVRGFCSNFQKIRTNFQFSKTLKNSFAAFGWKPFFTTKRVILTPQTKILSKHFSFDPPEGQFAFLDFFIKNCHHDINKVKFNRYTKFSKLFPEEKSALKSPKNAKT